MASFGSFECSKITLSLLNVIYIVSIYLLSSVSRVGQIAWTWLHFLLHHCLLSLNNNLQFWSRLLGLKLDRKSLIPSSSSFVVHSCMVEIGTLIVQHFFIYRIMSCFFLFQMIAFVLIGVAAYGKAVAIIDTVAALGGIIACGCLLLVLALIGLIGTVQHHQVMLFFVSFLSHSCYFASQSVTQC